MKKKPDIKTELASLVFVDRETNAIVVHIHGFETPKVASDFASYMLKNSGMQYEEANDCFEELPTIH